MSISRHDQGILHMVFGPMFSGKTTEGIRLIRRYVVLYGVDGVLCIKFKDDNRYTEEPKVSTHDKTTIPAVSVSTLSELGDTWKQYRAIFIDEGQFFADITEFVPILLNHQINVVISGLDGDYKKEPFQNNWLQMIPLATYVTKLHAFCKCGSPAQLTARITAEKEQNVVGGADKYAARCLRCHVVPGNSNNQGD